jgi:hypothetical protein
MAICGSASACASLGGALAGAAQKALLHCGAQLLSPSASASATAKSSSSLGSASAASLLSLLVGGLSSCVGSSEVPSMCRSMLSSLLNGALITAHSAVAGPLLEQAGRSLQAAVEASLGHSAGSAESRALLQLLLLNGSGAAPARCSAGALLAEAVAPQATALMNRAQSLARSQLPLAQDLARIAYEALVAKAALANLTLVCTGAMTAAEQSRYAESVRYEKSLRALLSGVPASANAAAAAAGGAAAAALEAQSPALRKAVAASAAAKERASAFLGGQNAVVEAAKLANNAAVKMMQRGLSHGVITNAYLQGQGTQVKQSHALVQQVVAQISTGQAQHTAQLQQQQRAQLLEQQTLLAQGQAGGGGGGRGRLAHK